MIISSGVFSILKFWFSELSGGRKGKKWPKMGKISVCRTFYFRNPISYDLHLWYTCMMYERIIYPGIFLFFFQNLQFSFCPKWQKFCLSHSVSQEPYIWLWFLVHMCKMMISPAIFFIFQNFYYCYWGFLEG